VTRLLQSNRKLIDTVNAHPLALGDGGKCGLA
jgi:hypothetical protein